MRLILMRHTKSDWSTAADGDHDRPLNARGLRSATALGAWLRATALMPNLALCSTARRAQQTFSGLALDCPTQVSDQLYLADAESLLRIIQDTQAHCLLVVAHNPGIANLARDVLKCPPKHDRFADYPTGATLVADIPVGTPSDIRLMQGTSHMFVTPADLT